MIICFFKIKIIIVKTNQLIIYFELSNIAFVNAELFRETIDSLNHLAEIYLINREIEKASDHIKLALERAIKLKAHYEECASYIILAKIYASQKNIENRDYYIQKALDLALRFEFINKLIEIYNQLISFNNDDFDFEKANYHKELLQNFELEIHQIHNSI